MTEIKAVKAIVSGRVQGVFFRAETKRAADTLSIKGWVRNLPNGCVEAVFEGDEKRIQKMITWCWQGSPGSSVSQVETQPIMDAGHFNSFEIRF